MSLVNSPAGVSVSFLVISYQQKDYIEEALNSALSQDYPGLQVVVSDDASTDGTWEIIQRIAVNYVGPHQIVIRRNDNNKGLATNFNEGVKCCSGELIVVQAGDDVSESYRVSALVKLWVNNDKAPDMLYSNVTWINHDGSVIRVDQHNHIIPSLNEIKRGKFYIAGGMATAYTRRLFNTFGYLSPAVKTEDYVLTFRALLSGGIAFEPAALLRYRQHAQSEMAVRRKLPDEYQRDLRYSLAKVAEAEDRYKSWKISQHSDYKFKLRLKRALISARLDNQSMKGSLGQSIHCLFMSLVKLQLKILIKIIKRDFFERQKNRSCDAKK